MVVINREVLFGTNESGDYVFYEKCTGAKATELEIVYDLSDNVEYLQILLSKKDDKISKLNNEIEILNNTNNELIDFFKSEGYDIR